MVKLKIDEEQKGVTPLIKELTEAVQNVLKNHKDNKQCGVIFGIIDDLNDVDGGASVVIGEHGNHGLKHALAESMKAHEEVGHYFEDGIAIPIGKAGAIKGIVEALGEVLGANSRIPKPKPEDIN